MAGRKIHTEGASATRRAFLASSAAAVGAAWWVGPQALAQIPPRSPNSRVRYAAIGVAKRGEQVSNWAAQHGDMAAICDVDTKFMDEALARPGFVGAQKFQDWREMFDKMAGKIDAVTIAIPDHQHAPAAAVALKNKIACYCEKPLTHTIWEARRLTEMAKEAGVATSMGNDRTALNGLRHAAALLKQGVIGRVQEVHVVTNRPIWPQGRQRAEPKWPPANLDWNLWLGPAPERPYADGYHTFDWRGWWDFGTGALGDMACHTFNMPFAGLNLADPVAIQAWSTGHNRDSYPQKGKIHFDFPHPSGTGSMPVWWYDGGNVPEESLLNGKSFVRTSGSVRGAIVVGEDLVLYAPGDYAERFMLLDHDGNEVPIPNADYEKSPGHFTEFHQVITGERPQAMSNFASYAGPLTETILLGNLAIYAAADGEGKRIEWDAKTLTATNAPEVQKIVKKEYRGEYGDPLGA